MPLVEHRPEGLECLVVDGDKLQMTVACRPFPLPDDPRLFQRGGELPVPLAMRLKVLELLHRRQQKTVRRLQRQLFNGVTAGQDRLGVEEVKMILEHAARQGAGTGFALFVGIPDRRVHGQVIADVLQENFVGQRLLF